MWGDPIFPSPSQTLSGCLCPEGEEGARNPPPCKPFPPPHPISDRFCTRRDNGTVVLQLEGGGGGGVASRCRPHVGKVQGRRHAQGTPSSTQHVVGGGAAVPSASASCPHKKRVGAGLPRGVARDRSRLPMLPRSNASVVFCCAFARARRHGGRRQPHRDLRHDHGQVHGGDLPGPRPPHGLQLHRPGEVRLLRRHPLPPGHPRVHEPVRLPLCKGPKEPPRRYSALTFGVVVVCVAQRHYPPPFVSRGTPRGSGAQRTTVALLRTDTPPPPPPQWLGTCHANNVLLQTQTCAYTRK